MEAKEVSSLTIGGMTLQSGLTFSISDEELKNFYLKEAILMLPDLCTPGSTEAEYLTKLQTEHNELLVFLSKLLDLLLPLDTGCLYEITSSYLLRDDIKMEERIRVREDMRRLFSICSLLQQKLDLTAELYNLYRTHHLNLTRVMQSLV